MSAMIETLGASWSVRLWWYWWGHHSGEGEGVGLAPASGSSAAAHGPCLMVACGVGPNGQSQCLWCILPMGTHLHDRIWKLRGVIGWEHGHLGPLTSIQHSVTAWAITYWPSWMDKGLAARCADLPSQVPAPVSVKAASLTLPKLRPSPREHLP